MSFILEIFRHFIDKYNLNTPVTECLTAHMIERLESSSNEDIIQMYSTLSLGSAVIPFNEEHFVTSLIKTYQNRLNLVFTTFVRLNDINTVQNYLRLFPSIDGLSDYILAIELGHIDLARIIWQERFNITVKPIQIYLECKKRNIALPFAYMIIFEEKIEVMDKHLLIAQTVDSDPNIDNRAMAYTIINAICHQNVKELNAVKGFIPWSLRESLSKPSYLNFIQAHTSEVCMKWYEKNVFVDLVD